MAKADWIKREAFARAYADCGNASQAARQAGVPDQSAHSMGYKWLRDRRVVEMVRDAMNDRLKALGPLAIGVVRDIMLSDKVSAQTRLHAATGWAGCLRGGLSKRSGRKSRFNK